MEGWREILEGVERGKRETGERTERERKGGGRQWRGWREEREKQERGLREKGRVEGDNGGGGERK